MKISSAFPSNYLKAADLDGRSVSVIIAKVILEQVNRGADQQPVVYFKNHTKGMVLNKTNAKKISEVYGDDTDNWVGREIILFEAMVEFQGDTVAALRVRHVPSKPAGHAFQASTGGSDSPQPQEAISPAVMTASQGSQLSTLLVEAEAMTKQGKEVFRGWRDGLREDEYSMLRPQMGRLISMADNQPPPLPVLSEAAKETLKKKKPLGMTGKTEDVF